MKYTPEYILQLLLGTALFASPLHAQDITQLGGDLTSGQAPNLALELPSPNIRSELFQFHLEGHGDFHGSFDGVKVNGRLVLGPNFNHNSCGGCHFKNGRGVVKFFQGSHGTPMLIKVSRPGLRSDGSPRNVPGIGEQLQDHTISGKSRYNIKMTFQSVRGSYPDGTRYTLRKPVLDFSIPGIDERKIVTSLRQTPPVIGMGLLEAVPEDTIAAMSDPFDLDQDGISGEVNYVPNIETGMMEVGRFGFRASQPTLRQQTATAFFHDMGMTSELFRGGSSKPIEVSNEILDRTTFYLQVPGVTPARDQSDSDVIAGKQLFQDVRCNACHVMTLQTEDSDIPELANQEFHPFTDLLLHDMGAGLSDKRPEFSASGREWRTTPLWGLGLTSILSSKKPGYLHDGRARTIEEAILWHGGEAQASRDQFKALERTQREQLIRFLRSL